MKNYSVLFLLLAMYQAYGQSDYYLVGEDASVNLNFSNSQPGDQGILFEARPIVRYNIWNKLRESLDINNRNDFKHTSIGYLIFSPHLRMYRENSEPVKMPSYRVALGFQQVWRLQSKDDSFTFLTAAGETGHYSNGQAGCAFSRRYPDGSPGCNAEYNTIHNNPNASLSAIINRTNGHFQTNFTSLYLNYRNFWKKRSYGFSYAQSLQLGYTLYHRDMLLFINYGGYSENDKQIYGRNRFSGSYAFSWRCNERHYFTLKQHFDLIVGAHPSVHPLRSVTSFSWYPSKRARNFGIKFAFISGHDDYNLRFVDRVNQFTVGAIFSPFELFSMNNTL